jgi:hypothetical protein
LREGSTKSEAVAKRVVLGFCPILKDESIDQSDLIAPVSQGGIKE